MSTLNKIITENDLKKYNSTETFADKAKGLLKHQLETWELCAGNYRGLERVEVKEFEFDGFVVKVQFNPARIKSSAAKVDKKSIEERPCFLCPENLPADQRGLMHGNDYMVLVNPFPIFPEHFTIPGLDHFPQLIEDNFGDMLSITRSMGKYYTLFYNGPKCGASAPDHMHFQAGNLGFMPIGSEYERIKTSLGTLLHGNDDIKIYVVENYLRRFIALESGSKSELVKAFGAFYKTFAKISEGDEEPRMNLITSYSGDKWKVFIFPRDKHRPSQYFEEEGKRILLSPASVDMGGVFITPREEDFLKITEKDIIDIFRQVSVSKEYFEYLKKALKEAYTAD